MLYLSKEKVVYLDTFQWEEISEDLMQEAAEKTGIDQVCCDTMQYSSVELSSLILLSMGGCRGIHDRI